MDQFDTHREPPRLDIFRREELQFADIRPQHWRVTLRSSAWRPPTDAFETEEAYVVRVEIAGMREEDFTIELEGRLLAIRGFRPDTAERRAYHLMEIRFGEFASELELPGPIQVDAIQANYADGFLWVVLPKAKPRHIPIEDKQDD